MTNTIKETLPTMLALAHDHSELSRIQLVGMLADIFLRSNIILSLREEEQLNELVDLAEAGLKDIFAAQRAVLGL